MERIEAKRAGIRWFVCEECNCNWSEPTRDCYSPSGEHCINCDEYCSPNVAVVVKGVYFNARGGVDPKEVRAAYKRQVANEEEKSSS